MTKYEFINQYGSSVFSFKSYYKYKFTYEHLESNSGTAEITFGGDSGSIYRLELADYLYLADVTNQFDAEEWSFTVIDDQGKTIQEG